MATVPRGTINNNPGNIRRSLDEWKGMSIDQLDDSFVQFETPHFGIRAATRNLQTSFKKYGNDTVRNLITRWAPPSENDTEAYINFISGKTGFDPDEPIAVTNPIAMRKLLEGIFEREGTIPGTYADDIFNNAIRDGLGLPPSVLASAISDGIAKSPDTVAKNLTLANRFNMTLDQLENLDSEAVKEHDQTLTITQGIEESPATAEYLSQPNAMALSHDVVEELTFIEDVVNIGRAFIGSPIDDVFGGSLRGIGDLSGQAARGMEEFYDAAGLTDLRRAVQLGFGPLWMNPAFFKTMDNALTAVGETIGEIGEAIRPAPEEATLASDIAGGLGQVAAHITIAIATGGLSSVTSLVTLTGQGVDIQSQRLEEAGVDPISSEADLARVGGGIVTAATERIGLGVLFKRIPLKIRGRIWRALAGFGTEATQEVIEGVAHNLIALGLYDPGQDIFKGSERDALVGGSVGGIVGLILPGRGGSRSIRSHKALDKADKLIQESRLQGRSVEHSADHTAAIAAEYGIQRVFIPVKDIVDYASKHEEGADVAMRQLGITEDIQINEAGEIEIDGGVFASNILGTPNYAALGDSIRMETGRKSAKEAAEAITEHATTVLEQVEETEEDTGRTDISSGLKKRVAKLINKTKEMSPKEIIDEVVKTPVDVTNVLDALIMEAEEKALDVTEIQRKGRTKEITAQLSNLDGQIIALTKDIEQRIDEGRSIKASDARLLRLAEQRDDLVGEQERLEQGEEVGKRKTIRVKASQIKSIETITTRKTIVAVRRGFKRGRKVAREDAKSARRQFVQIIKDSGIKNQAKFLKRLVGLDTTEQLTKILPKLESQLVAELETQQRSELLNEITNQLKGTRSPQREGKFDPDTQALLDIAREVNSMSRKEAAFELDEALQNDSPSPSDVWRNQMLAIAAREDFVTNDDLRDALSNIVNLKTEGQIAAAKRIDKLRTEVEQTRDTMVQATLQGGPIKREDTSTIAKRLNRRAKRLGAFGSALWNAWDDTLDIVFNKKGVDGKFINKLTMTRELLNVRVRIHKWQTQMKDKAIEIYGLKNQTALVTKLYDDNVVHKVGEYINTRGKRVEMAISRAEARDLWMKLQDPQMAPSLLHANGNAYTEEILREVFFTNDNTKLSDQDKVWAEAQVEFYSEIFPDINEVHRNMYGTNMAFNSRFSPTQTDKGDLEGADRDVGSDSAIIDEGAKRRKLRDEEGIVPQMLRSDTQVMHRYMHDVAHFIETAERVRLLKHTFSDSRVKKAIAQNHTESTNRQIDKFIDDFARGYVKRGQAAEEWIGYFNRNFSRSVLGLKATIGLKQTTSVLAMGENIPPGQFVAGMFDFIKSPKKNMKKIFEAMPSLATRGSSIDLELAKLGQVEEDILRLKKTGRLDDFFVAMIKWGDRVPIYLGTHSRAKWDKKQGISFEDSVAKSEILAERTQQSVQLDQLSDLQRMGPAGRTLTLFMTARLALLRSELRAMRQVKRGKISKAEFGKRFAYYHIVMPAMISMIGAGMAFDEEDFIKSVLLGQLTSFILFGDVLEAITLEALGGDVWGQVRDIPIVETINDVFQGATKLISEGATVEEMWEGMDQLSDAAGAFFGVPVKGGKNIVIGAYEIGDAEDITELKTGIRRVVGWSERIAKKASADEASGRIKF